MEETAAAIQIVQFPEECLTHIFKYLDYRSREDVSLVCRRFYEIICDLEKDQNPLELSYSQIYDDETYNSVIASSRRLCDLTIDLKGCRVLSSLMRIEAIVSKFGTRIKKLKVWSSIQSESAEMSEKQLAVLLKLVPNVEHLLLRNIIISASFGQVEELCLLKLKKLLLDDCMLQSSKILDAIPKDVLTELVFTFDGPDESQFQNFFDRQSRIKKLEIFENAVINFNHFQLEHLKISSSHDFISILQHQPKLRYLDFAISWIDDDVFAAVCQLKQLEVFRTLIDLVTLGQFKSLQEMTKLKELRLDSHSSNDHGHLLQLSLMKGLHQLEKLTLLLNARKIPDEILIQMSLSFKRLRHIEIVNRSIKIISVILQNFPLLESVLFDFFSIFGAPNDILEIPDELSHENLKQLVIINGNVNEVANTISVLRLASRCPNLERLMLSELRDVTVEEFKQILDSHQKLRYLSLEFDNLELTPDAYAAIKEFAVRLAFLRLNGLYEVPGYQCIKTAFKENFSNITLYKYSNGSAELITKKRNVPDWHHSFKLLDHF